MTLLHAREAPATAEIRRMLADLSPVAITSRDPPRSCRWGLSPCGTLWLAPAKGAELAQGAAIAAVDIDALPAGLPLSHDTLARLAVAARQRLWRALQAVPGPGPIIGIGRCEAPAQRPAGSTHRLTAVMPGVPKRRPPPGTLARMQGVLLSAPMARDVDWALGRPRRRG
ncbi:MAG: hypothetical protein AAFQ88_13170 [Pseudomonadota bacterium]